MKCHSAISDVGDNLRFVTAMVELVGKPAARGDPTALPNRNQAVITKFADYWAKIESHYKERYPFLLVLITLIMCLPIGTAECERIFSYMNRLKDQVHNRRGNSTLRNLIMILCNGPKSLLEFEQDIDRFIDHWEAQVDRRHNFGL